MSSLIDQICWNHPQRTKQEMSTELIVLIINKEIIIGMVSSQLLPTLTPISLVDGIQTCAHYTNKSSGWYTDMCTLHQ